MPSCTLYASYASLASLPSLLPAPLALAQQPASPAGSALPDIHQLMREVHEHQKQLE